MRSEGKSFALAFLTCLSATPMTGAPAQPPAAEHGFVVRVSDGDTILVNLHGHLEKVRLIGVDTPEIGRGGRASEPFALEAARFTRRMVGHKRILLQAEPGRPDRDGYGRLLRYVLLESRICLNAELIRAGYGRELLRFPFSRSREYKALERQAREARRGLWDKAGSGRGGEERPPE